MADQPTRAPLLQQRRFRIIGGVVLLMERRFDDAGFCVASPDVDRRFCVGRGLARRCAEVRFAQLLPDRLEHA